MQVAPSHGEDDYQVLKGTGIPVVCPVDAECKFTDEVSDYKGVFVKEVQAAVLDGRADQFSFCVTAWEAFTCARPASYADRPLPLSRRAIFPGLPLRPVSSR